MSDTGRGTVPDAGVGLHEVGVSVGGVEDGGTALESTSTAAAVDDPDPLDAVSVDVEAVFDHKAGRDAFLKVVNAVVVGLHMSFWTSIMAPNSIRVFVVSHCFLPPTLFCVSF